MLKGVEGTIVTRFDYQNILISLGIVLCGLILLVWIGALGTLADWLRNRSRRASGTLLESDAREVPDDRDA